MSAGQISLHNVGLSFRPVAGGAATVVLDQVALDVAPGEFVTVLGPSGCGKTTLLRLIDGLLQPDTGTVRVDGRAPRTGPDIGFVFQSFRLLPWANAARNVAFGLELAGVALDKRAAASARWLGLMGLSDAANRYPAELSGGMQQRVALARALATEPRILLMDEPFASLDAMTREVMQFELLRLWSAQQTTVVFVTHSIEEALLLGDRVVVMGQAPGSIRAIVPVDLPRPRSEATRESAGYLALRRQLSALIRDANR